MSRTFFVKLNLDDLCAELDTLRPDQHYEWISGFRAGARGRIPEGWDGPRLLGAEFGHACFKSAEAFRESASIAGKRSAEVRRYINGTAQPERNAERPSNDLRTTFERNTERNTELTSIQYPIESNPVTKNQEREKTGRFAPPSFDEVLEYCQSRKNNVDPQRFIDFYESKGWMVGKSKMKSWQASIRTWEKRGDEASTSHPSGTILDQQGRPCPYPNGSDAALNWYVMNAPESYFKQ